MSQIQKKITKSVFLIYDYKVTKKTDEFYEHKVKTALTNFKSTNSVEIKLKKFSPQVIIIKTNFSRRSRNKTDEISALESK